MKKIGIISPPAGNIVRGVGYYTKNLISALQKISQNHGIEIGFADSVDSGEFDLVHYPFFDLFYPTLPFVKNTRTIVTVHDVVPLEFPGIYVPGIRGSFNYYRQKLALFSADLVITDSYASVKSIRHYLHLPHSQIKLVYLAAANHMRPLRSESKLARIKEKYHLPSEFVMYVGDINWNKNLPGLMLSCIDLKIPLVLIGKQFTEIETIDINNPQLKHLTYIKSLLSSHQSLFFRLGFVPDADLVAIYNLAGVYCQPSFAEGFGIPVLEAMACGTPVVCSNTHSLPEIAGTAAMYFDPRNLAEMTASLSSLFNNSKLRSEYSRLGLLQAKKFSWEKTALEMLTIYKQFI